MRRQKNQIQINNAHHSEFAGTNSKPQKEEPSRFLMALPLLGRIYRVEQTVNKIQYHCGLIQSCCNKIQEEIRNGS
ncbi:MAG: hypothetical protein ACTSXD_05145 [Candidatus Heimdallarchaeaceae archaeon]